MSYDDDDDPLRGGRSLVFLLLFWFDVAIMLWLGSMIWVAFH